MQGPRAAGRSSVTTAAESEGTCRSPAGTLRAVVNASSAPALDITLPAVPGAASAARRAVHAIAAGLVAEDYDVALAVSEAVTNVVVHAYRDRAAAAEPGEVHVAVSVEATNCS